MADSRKIIVSADANARVAAARAWLESLAPASEALVIAHVREAADEIVRATAAKRGALAGVHRLTLNRLAALLASDRNAGDGLAPAAGLAAEAVAARAVFRLTASGALKFFEPVLDRPGFARALARTIAEVRLSNISVAQLRGLGGAGEALGAMLEQFDAELHAARLIDRAAMIAIAADAVRADPPPRFAGLPLVLLDLQIEGAVDRDLIAELALRAPSVLATVPAGDERGRNLLEAALGVTGTPAQSPAETSLDRLKAY
ncbi:MAG TPA: hypothetical protein VMT58_09290, partial [Candidatus Binataceae bacterium]|nr:hypothetical protein [Candidatus Binataceae bacterium]